MYTIQKEILKHTGDNNGSHASQKCLSMHLLLKVEPLDSLIPLLLQVPLQNDWSWCDIQSDETKPLIHVSLSLSFIRSLCIFFFMKLTTDIFRLQFCHVNSVSVLKTNQKCNKEHIFISYLSSTIIPKMCNTLGLDLCMASGRRI